MASLKELLHPDILTDAYSRQANPRPFPITETFYTNPENMDDDEFRLFFDPEEQQPVPGNVFGAPAKVIQLAEASERVATLFYAYNKIQMKGTVLNAIREPNSQALQQMGKTEVARQMNKFRVRHQIYKEVVLGQVLGQGKVYFDGFYNPLPSSSGAKLTVDMGVDATHKTDLDGLVTALFSETDTDIQAILDSIRNQAENEGVEEPTEIYCNAWNKQYLRNNESFISWAQASNQDAAAVLRGGIIEDLWGWNWHFIGGKWKDGSGNKNATFPIQSALICPAPGPWLKATAGKSILPTSLDIKADPDEALASAVDKYGPFSFAKLDFDPASLNMYMGDKFGLHFADPGAVWIADAFPSTYSS